MGVMPNQTDIEILNKGLLAWNAWVKVHRMVRHDLSGAVLRGADLEGADFTDVDLSGADLSGAHLRGAVFSYATLYGSNLSKATLTFADLTNSYFRKANLTGTYLSASDLTNANLSRSDLSGAHLYSTVFKRTYLEGVNFAGATLSGAVFTDVDLSVTEGLGEVEHREPSAVSVNTIYRSRGNIPEVFLRGCGVPESFIVQIPALVAAMQPIQFYSCFISYSSKDEGLAQRLHADLQAKGVRCWFAPEDLKIGERFRRRIDEAIRVYDRLLLILSKHSVASSWVEKEVETAMESEDEQNRTILFPVRLDDSVMEEKTGWPADVRRTRHIGDFRRWKEHDEYQKAFARLLDDLKTSA